MWGLPVLCRWALPSPQAAGAAVVRLAGEPQVIALLGSQHAGPRGRFSVLGLPACAQRLEPGPGVITKVGAPSETLRVVLLGYEMGYPEVHLTPPSPPRGQPAGLALELPAALIIDHHEQEALLVGTDAALGDRLAAALLTPGEQVPHTSGGLRFEPAVSDTTHAARISRVQEHIAAGDIYQANLTRRLSVCGTVDPAAALATLTTHNPVAHGAYLKAAGVELLSNSMETLLAYDPSANRATSLPIKGTCARGVTHLDDLARAQRLAQDPKERAEHLMIVDLIRNDLGKVAACGTVRVPQLFTAEPYRGVWHLVSTVEGTLKSEQSTGQLLAALFPGGSITGAPKRRAMQLIAEIEAEPRGFYTGSLGFIAPDGTASFSILIRTLVKDADGWSLGVGGGIVADSNAAREIEETWEKIEVFRQLLA